MPPTYSSKVFPVPYFLLFDHPTLLKLLMEQVISKIVHTITTFEPKGLTVNGILPLTGWDGKGFTFKKMFPLIGATTNFTDSILYKVYKDSITQTNDTIHIPLKDTAVTVNFPAAVSGTVIPDSTQITSWGRNLGFFFNGASVTTVVDSMNKLEIRFSEYKVDMLYGYSNVRIVLSTAQGNPVDKETLTLQKSAAYFSATIPCVIVTAKQGDGILQHQTADNLIAVFRNPELPLDTLRITIPFYHGTAFTIANAVYFDNSADGHVDSVYLGITGEKLAGYAGELIKHIPLPAHRNFEVVKHTVEDRGLGLTVNERSPLILTYCTADDVIKIPDTVKIYLQLDATILDRYKTYTVSSTIVNNDPPIKAMLDKAQKNTDGSYTGLMFIMLVPKPKGILPPEIGYEATVSIIDPLGNTVVENQPMGHSPDNGRLFIWNGMNNQAQRRAGPGAYLAVVRITHFMSNHPTGVVETRKCLVGVRY
jgi:hypothetical protein